MLMSEMRKNVYAKVDRSRFDRILSYYKGKDSEVENLIFVIGGKDMTICKAVVAWKNTNSELQFSEEDNISDDWEYIWQFCYFDREQFAVLCGVDIKESDKLFERIKMLKLIYPDGTVNDTANGVIKSILKQAITKITGKVKI